MATLAEVVVLVLAAGGAFGQNAASPAKAPAAAPKSPAPSAPAAVVNGEPIMMFEVEGVLAMMPPPKTPPTDLQKYQMRMEALDMLIDDVLIRQFLSVTVPKVTQADFNKEFGVLQASLKERHLTMQDFLKETNQTEDHLRMDVVKKLQWDHYVQEQATEAALKKYYEANRDHFDRASVQASHIMIRLGPTASEAERNQAKLRLQQLRQQIVGGQLDFAEAAKKYSQGPSASAGGDIGSFHRKFEVEEPLAKAAFSLQPGQVSEVVQTEYGLHLIKVTGRTPGVATTFEAVKEKVRADFAMELWSDILTRQRKIAKIDVRLPKP
jgi:peptidyl-prolyl cis-trans isomerase C